MKSVQSAILYIVATPIGNLGDFSSRAISTLKEVDLILAEDTRTFGLLKNKFNIKTKTKSYHEHNEKKVFQKIIDFILLGNKVALVSDAGTPCISDPGYRLVKASRENNVQVRSIPGPSALIAALSISGFEIYG